jgi:hypothetical protein
MWIIRYSPAFLCVAFVSSIGDIFKQETLGM